MAGTMTNVDHSRAQISEIAGNLGRPQNSLSIDVPATLATNLLQDMKNRLATKSEVNDLKDALLAISQAIANKKEVVFPDLAPPVINFSPEVKPSEQTTVIIKDRIIWVGIIVSLWIMWSITIALYIRR